MLVTTVFAVPIQIWVSIGKYVLSDILNTLIDWERVCIKHLKNNIPINRLCRAYQEVFDNATHCHICRKPVEGDLDLREPKVGDHDYVTGWFIAAADQQCNLQQSVNYQIPVLFHNFRGYDFDLIVHEFFNIQDRKLKVIGQKREKYLQVQLGPNIVFRDSLQFLISSLDFLFKSFAETGRQNFYLIDDTIRNFYPDETDEILWLVVQKGVFCYDYIDKFERLDKTALLAREQFYNRMAG